MTKSIKYEPLKDYLMNVHDKTLNLAYEKIEQIIEKPLPASAFKYRAWWANGGHSQASAWLDAGWKVETVDLGKSVIFLKELRS